MLGFELAGLLVSWSHVGLPSGALQATQGVIAHTIAGEVEDLAMAMNKAIRARTAAHRRSWGQIVTAGQSAAALSLPASLAPGRTAAVGEAIIEGPAGFARLDGCCRAVRQSQEGASLKKEDERLAGLSAAQDVAGLSPASSIARSRTRNASWLHDRGLPRAESMLEPWRLPCW